MTRPFVAISVERGPACLEWTSWGGREPAAVGSFQALALSPNRWLLICEGSCPDEGVPDEPDGAWVDLTGALARIRLEGPGAADLLARGCASAAVDGRAIQAPVFEVPSILIGSRDGRIDVYAPPSYIRYLIEAMERSLAIMGED